VNDPHRDAGAATIAASRDPSRDDGQLLRRIGQGDEDAMAAFYREHGRVVLAQVLLVTGERVLAEEIVQDTMLAVWRGAGSFRGDSSVRSWVIAIARRQTRDRLRGRRLRVVGDAFLADQPGSDPGLEPAASRRHHHRRRLPPTGRHPVGNSGPVREARHRGHQGLLAGLDRQRDRHGARRRRLIRETWMMAGTAAGTRCQSWVS
jgi:RNA polymerase sigma factor (sigma-70 family)